MTDEPTFYKPKNGDVWTDPATGARSYYLDGEWIGESLIKAASDLLAALRGVVAVADRDTVEFRAARAAIAKAESGS